MKKQSSKTVLRCVVIIALTFALSYSISSASAVQSPTSHVPELVTLTVLSTCSSAQVRLRESENVKTPFSKTFPRGQAVVFEVLDTVVPACNALPVETSFKRLIVNNKPLNCFGKASRAIPFEKATS